MILTSATSRTEFLYSLHFCHQAPGSLPRHSSVDGCRTPDAWTFSSSNTPRMTSHLLLKADATRLGRWYLYPNHQRQTSLVQEQLYVDVQTYFAAWVLTDDAPLHKTVVDGSSLRLTLPRNFFHIERRCQLLVMTLNGWSLTCAQWWIFAYDGCRRRRQRRTLALERIERWSHLDPQAAV
jgi:hypothetical protein